MSKSPWAKLGKNNSNAMIPSSNRSYRAMFTHLTQRSQHKMSLETSFRNNDENHYHIPLFEMSVLVMLVSACGLVFVNYALRLFA